MPTIERAVVASACAGRVALGTAFVLAPRQLAHFWTGEAAPTDGILARGLGIRDALLGAGALAALAEGDSPSRWLQAGALSDAVDAAITLASLQTGSRERKLAFAAGAGAAAVTCAVISTRASVSVRKG